MRIACVTQHQYPTDQEVRVARLSVTVTSRGHDFVVFSPGDRTRNRDEELEFGRVIRLRPLIPGFLGRYVVAPLPINPIWFWWLLKRFREERFDVVVVRDLRLALPAFIAARVLKIKTVLDIGEHYPGLMIILGKEKWRHYLIRNIWLINRLEWLSVRLADLVWVVVEENADRLRPLARQIETINNYPMTEVHEEEKSSRTRQYAYSDTGDPLVLVSFGIVDRIRGLDLAIDALAILVKEFSNLKLAVYGDGPYREVLEEKVATLALEGVVEFRGWVDPELRNRTLASGHVGLLLHSPCELTQHTMPNKLFDYLRVGLPVVSTRLAPVVRVLESEHCGIVVEETAQAIAEGIRRLIEDQELRQRCSDAGYHAVRARYSWATEAEKIGNSIAGLIGFW